MKESLDKPNDFSFDDIEVGDNFSFEKIVDEKLLGAFAEISGDYNPLHVDDAYAKQAGFKGRIAHGMLLGSFFSTLVGMFIPGKRALYLSQELNFRNPLDVPATVTVSGTVLKKHDALKIIELKTMIKGTDGETIIDGVARVKVLEK